MTPDIMIDELTIPQPDEFEGHLRESDLVDLDKRDVRLMIAMSKLEAQIKWVMLKMVEMNSHLRHLENQCEEANERQTRLEEDQKKLNWKAMFVMWFGTVFGAGVIAAMVNGAVKVWFEKKP